MKKQELPPGFWEKMEAGYFYHPLQLDLQRVYLEISSRCNFNCITCIRHSWKESPGDMEVVLLEKILDELESLPRRPLIYFGGFGEPLYHPQIMRMITLVRERGFRLRITTNGQLLGEELRRLMVEERVEELIVSCDSTEDSVFQAIRSGGSLEKIRSNLKELFRLKNKQQRTYPRVSLEFVLMRRNARELKRLPELARQLHAGRILITHLLPYSRELQEEILYDGSFSAPEPLLWTTPERDYAGMAAASLPRFQWGAMRSCPFIERRSASISYQGQVSPCYPLLHPYSYYIFGCHKEVSPSFYGSVQQEDLASIWQNREYVKFRNRVRLFRFPSCVDCDLGPTCDLREINEDCWGNSPSCADCLWAQNIIRCP